jgi:hypothetical protein
VKDSSSSSLSIEIDRVTGMATMAHRLGDSGARANPMREATCAERPPASSRARS